MKPSNKESKTAPDGGYGWVIVTCTGIITGIMQSCFKCIGQVFEAMVQRTTLSRLEIAVACVLPNTIMAVFAIVGSKLCEVYSFRGTLFLGVLTAAIGIIFSSLSTFNIVLFTLTFGLFTGVGCGLTLPLSTIVTGLYFTKRRPFALGVMLCINNVIGILMPPLLQHFFDQYQLEGGLLLWSGVWLQGCIAALLVRHPKWALQKKFTKQHENLPMLVKESEKLTVFTQDEEKSTISVAEPNLIDEKFCEKKFNCVQFIVFILKDIWADCRNFQNYVFVLLLVNRMSELFGLISTYLILPQFIMEQNQNISHTQVAFLLSLISIGDILARPVSGWIMSVIPNHGKNFYLLSLVLVGVTQCAFQFAQSYTSFIIFSIIFGIFNGYTMVAYYNAIFEIFGPKQITGVNALHITFSRLFIITSAPITTAIRNLTGSYSQCLTLIGVFNFATVILWLSESLCFNRKQIVI